MVIARLQMLAVFEAPTFSRASTTNETDFSLSFAEYCENPPLRTSDWTYQMAEKIFCGRDCSAKSSLPNLVCFDSDKSITKSAL